MKIHEGLLNVPSHCRPIVRLHGIRAAALHHAAATSTTMAPRWAAR
ncbi:MAG: hypothetical protein ACYC3K_02040 [Candidatus Nanopelagicales bacterium]